jgi:hypothetical protein
MALHHAATNIFHDHFLQGAFLTVSVSTAYVVSRIAGPATSVGHWVAAAAKMSAAFAVVSTFVNFTLKGEERHLQDEGRRIEDPEKAMAINIRANHDQAVVEDLNRRRVCSIRRRFRRTRIISMILAPLFIVPVLRRVLKDTF